MAAEFEGVTVLLQLFFKLMSQLKKNERSQIATFASRALIDTRRLFYFFNVAKMGSFSAAETLLDVAQSAMSRQIQQLEIDLNTQLLDRTGRGVALTAVGEVLFKHAGNILDEMAYALKAVETAKTRPTGQISIAGSSIVMSRYMPEILRRFLKIYPDFQVTAIQASTGEVYQQLVDGHVDLAVILNIPNSSKLASRRLMTESMIVGAQTEHAIAAKSYVTPKDLTELELILPASRHGLREVIDLYCEKNGIKLSAQIQVDSVPLIKALVAETLSCAIMPLSSFKDEFDKNIFIAIPLRPTFTRTLYAASLSERAKLPHIVTFTKCIVAAIKG